jgi:predicted DNA-binding transcriptional regulator YafY
LPRNAEVIRQWAILRDLESSRRLTIDEMSARTGVTTRTIRRDLEALQEAGFPLFDEVHDGKRYWTLEHRAFRRLDETGFTLAELSALYFSRTLVECLAATPFQDDVRNAFAKLAGALTPGMRQFLDRLPLAIQAKAEPGTRPARDAAPAGAAPKPTQRVAQLLDATLHNRRITLRYHSFSSNREKTYLVEPQRLVFAQGGLYLVAFVPEYAPHAVAVGQRGTLRAAGSFRRRVRALVGCASGTAGADRNRVRAAHGPVCEGTCLARVAADRRST